MIAKTRHAPDRIKSSPGLARGVLNQRLPTQQVEHLRVAPSQRLAPWVAHYWHVGWNLDGQPEQQQETLPHPNVHLVVEDGQARLWGVHRGRFTKNLSGQGWAFGVKFKPAAFQPLWGRAVSQLTDRSIAAVEVFGTSADSLVVDEWPGMEAMCQRAEALLMKHRPLVLDDTVNTLAELVACASRGSRPSSASSSCAHAPAGACGSCNGCSITT